MRKYHVTSSPRLVFVSVPLPPFNISEIRVHLTIDMSVCCGGGFLALTPHSPTSPVPQKLQLTGDGILELWHLSWPISICVLWWSMYCGRLLIVVMETITSSVSFSGDVSVKKHPPGH